MGRPSLLWLALLLGSVAFRSASGADEEIPGSHIFAMQADGSNVRRVASLPDHPSVCSPEISPDGSKVAVDAWRAGESSTDAHLLVVHLADGRIDDLGIGCMPTWSADGASIAYCQYGKGVFIKSLDGKSDECLDPLGWAIQWSPDGKKLAYIKNDNLVIYDRATGTREAVFPEGESPYQGIYHNPTWSPDSTQICFMGVSTEGGPELAFVAARRSLAEDVAVLRPAADLNPDIAWRPGHREVLVVQQPVGGRPGQMLSVKALKPMTGAAAEWRFEGQPAERHNGGMSWSRDGETLYFISAR